MTALSATVAAAFAAVAAADDMSRSPLWTWVIWACSATAVVLACSVLLVPRLCFYSGGATIFVLVADAATAAAAVALHDPLTATMLVTGALGILGVFAVFYNQDRPFATHIAIAAVIAIATASRMHFTGQHLLMATIAVWLSTGMHLACRVYWQQLQRDAQVAYFDPLTGTTNRAGLERNLAGLLVETKASEHVLVVLVDIDRFKRVNDTYGHDVGDRILIATADHLHHHFGRSSTISRSGGEEFVVVVNASAHVVEQLLQTFVPVVAGTSTPSVTISSGATLCHIPQGTSRTQFDQALESLDQAIKRADHLMYTAKRDGGARLYTNTPCSRRR